MAKKAVKKVTKKVAKKKATPKPKTVTKSKYGKVLGRPKGSIFESKDISVRDQQILGRADQPLKVDGLRWVRLQTSDPDNAVRLKRLAELVERKDKNLLALLDAAKPKRAKKKVA